MPTKSPSSAVFSTVSRRPSCSRRRSTCSSIFSSSTAGSRRGASIVDTSPPGAGGLRAGGLDGGPVAQGGGRAHADLDREGQRLALGRQVAEVDVGIAH